MKILIVIVTLSILTGLNNVHAAVLQLHEQAGSIKFTAIGKPAMLRISGEGLGPEGQLNLEDKKISGEVQVQLKSLKTGIDLRDEHMKNKYLEVSSYPDAKLKLNNIDFPQSLEHFTGKATSQKFSGILTLHGVSMPIEGQFDISADDKSFQIKAQYSINLSDYNIQIPNYAGLKIADKVDIEILFSIIK